MTGATFASPIRCEPARSHSPDFTTKMIAEAMEQFCDAVDLAGQGKSTTIT